MLIEDLLLSFFCLISDYYKYYHDYNNPLMAFTLNYSEIQININIYAFMILHKCF